MAVYGVKENKCFQDMSQEMKDIATLRTNYKNLLERVSKLESHMVVESGFLNSVGTVTWTLYGNGRLVIDGSGDTGTYDNSDKFTPIYNLKNVMSVEVTSAVGTVNTGAIAFETAEPTTLIANCNAIGSGAFVGDWTNSIEIGNNTKNIGANAFPGAGSKHHIGVVQNAPILYYDGTTNEWARISLADGWSNHAYFDNDQVVCSDGTVAIT